jgi:CDP-diacylglycerol--serine O-phosphatidyltransferase
MSARPQLTPPPPVGKLRRRLAAVNLLPTIATLGNLLCGTAALLCGFFAIRAPYYVPAVPPHVPGWLAELCPTYVAGACYLIVLALVCDALDGRLARMTRRTSEFGAQLDSLSDVVSFGVAPALLMLTVVLNADQLWYTSRFGWRLVVLAALTFVTCAALRLARYNVENTRADVGHRLFSGLPTPGGAAVLIGLLLIHEDPEMSGWTKVPLEWVLPPVALALGFLMVSRLDYLHVLNVYTRRRRPLWHLVGLLVIVAVGWRSPPVLIAGLACAYVISGLVVGRRRGAALHVGPPPAPSA